MDFIIPPLVIGIISYFTYMVFELFARRKERMFLIEKMGQNLTPLDSSVLKSQFCSLLPSFPKKSFTGLRTGCMLVGLGLGLLIGLFIALYIEYIPTTEGWRRDSFCSAAFGASVLSFGGLGLIISYIIENRSTKKEDQ